MSYIKIEDHFVASVDVFSITPRRCSEMVSDLLVCFFLFLLAFI